MQVSQPYTEKIGLKSDVCDFFVAGAVVVSFHLQTVDSTSIPGFLQREVTFSDVVIAAFEIVLANAPE